MPLSRWLEMYRNFSENLFDNFECETFIRLNLYTYGSGYVYRFTANIEKRWYILDFEKIFVQQTPDPWAHAAWETCPCLRVNCSFQGSKISEEQ